jgi:hypothetical protein
MSNSVLFPISNAVIPFNAINSDEFVQMCEVIGQFGPGFSPPSKEHVRGVLLIGEYERTKSLVQEYDDEKMKIGCSVMTCRCFFAPARYRVVKIACSCFEVVLRTMKNYKAHYSLSWFSPLLRDNSPTSSIFCIEEEEQCYNRVS